jgi:hypothetical protein
MEQVGTSTFAIWYIIYMIPIQMFGQVPKGGIHIPVIPITHILPVAFRVHLNTVFKHPNYTPQVF